MFAVAKTAHIVGKRNSVLSCPSIASAQHLIADRILSSVSAKSISLHSVGCSDPVRGWKAELPKPEVFRYNHVFGTSRDFYLKDLSKVWQTTIRR